MRVLQGEPYSWSWLSVPITNGEIGIFFAEIRLLKDLEDGTQHNVPSLPTYFCGGTRRYLLVSLGGPLPYGFCLNCLSITFLCHILILSLAILLLWSNATRFINKSPPRIPDVHLPDKPFLQVASALRIEINRVLAILRDIASGRDLKKFLGLSYCYIRCLMPVLYERYEEQVDSFAEKAMIEFKKQYVVFDAKVLSKIPRGTLKDKKRA
ncbi:hypothetical protein U1Q18_023671 [Sarracenia purpurea var. burkii]